MNGISPILVQGGNQPLAKAWGAWVALGTDVRNQLIMVGSCALLILALLVWAAFFRKAKKRRRRIDRPHRWEVAPGERSAQRPHRRHHKHHGERHRNPTLAETGGLPPIRPQPPEPPAPPTD
jgi:hypothetical protein